MIIYKTSLPISSSKKYIFKYKTKVVGNKHKYLIKFINTHI